MNHVQDILVQRYARAMLRIVPSEQVIQDIEKLRDIQSFFIQHKVLFLSLQLSMVIAVRRQHFFDIFQEAYALEKVYINLLRELVEKGRVLLLSAILEALIEKAYEQQGVIQVTVISSHELEDKQRLKVMAFIKQHIVGKIGATFVVDHALIVGIRIISSQYLWERSLAKKLRMIEQGMKLQGVLG